MARKTYKSPIFFGGLTPEDDPIIVIKDSQDTTGYDNQWTFEGISDADMDMIDLNCGYFDLQKMDANGDYIITQAEFAAWLADRGGW